MAINLKRFNEVVEAAKSKAAGNARWIRAIDKASAAILSGEMIVTTLAHSALVTSPNGSYFVNGHCQCRAAQRGHSECYHRAAARIWELYETEAAKPASRADIIADIKAAWSRRFPGESLADELMRRFRRNQLEMLSVDFLTAIRAAIA